MVSTFLVLMVVLAGCGPKTVAKVTVGPNPSPPLVVSVPEKIAKRAIVTVIPVRPLTMAPKAGKVKTGSAPRLVEIVLSGNPHPEWISAKDYARLVDHVNRGGKWILNNFCVEGGQKQCFSALDGTKVALTGLMSGARLDYGKQNFLANWDHPDRPYHDHLGIFPVTGKMANKRSRKYHCPMPYSIFYLNGEAQAMHACQPKDARRLGTPASHGCDRVHFMMAPKLYAWAPVDEYRSVEGRSVLIHYGTEVVYVVNVCIPLS